MCAFLCLHIQKWLCMSHSDILYIYAYVEYVTTLCDILCVCQAYLTSRTLKWIVMWVGGPWIPLWVTSGLTEFGILLHPGFYKILKISGKRNLASSNKQQGFKWGRGK